MPDLPRVCDMSAYNRAYPRNLILQRGPAAHGVDAIECRVPVSPDARGRADPAELTEVIRLLKAITA